MDTSSDVPPSSNLPPSHSAAGSGPFYRLAAISAIAALIGALATLGLVGLGLNDNFVKSLLQARIDDLSTVVGDKQSELENLVVQKRDVEQHLASIRDQAIEEERKHRAHKAAIQSDVKSLHEGLRQNLWNIVYPAILFRCGQSITIAVNVMVPPGEVIIATRDTDNLLRTAVNIDGSMSGNFDIVTGETAASLRYWSNVLFSISDSMQQNVGVIFVRNETDLENNPWGLFVGPLSEIRQLSVFRSGQSPEFKKLAEEMVGEIQTVEKNLGGRMHSHFNEGRASSFSERPYMNINSSDMKRIRQDIQRSMEVQRVVLLNLTLILFPDFEKAGASALPFSPELSARLVESLEPRASPPSHYTPPRPPSVLVPPPPPMIFGR